MNTSRALLLILAIATPISTTAGWQDLLDKLPIPTKSTSPTAGSALSLTDAEMTAGLKEALDKATEIAVNQLGQDGGYLNNPAVRIPMPEKLAWVEKSLRTVGQDALADEFIGTMNHAAEQAVPVALDQFRSAIRNMTLADAKGILTGPNDAATQYFRTQSEDNLREQFRPIVESTTAEAGVTSAYKNMTDRVGSLGGLGGLMNTDALDLDQYVTDKALDGLFVMVAQEEARIRENPVARSTDLLKKVFGAASN